jgi:hypothetical protein
VHRLAGSLPSYRQRLFVATLEGGEGAVVSHLAACALWRLDGVRCDDVEISVARTRRPRTAQRPYTASAISSRSTWVRRHGRPAVSKILDVVPERPRRVVEETWLEAKILRLIAEAGLPPPRPQARLRHSGGKARVDFAYDEARLLVEVDGHGTHSTRQERRSDAERDVRLTIQRWRVARFTREDVVDRPDYVVGALRRLLAIR